MSSPLHPPVSSLLTHSNLHPLSACSFTSFAHHVLYIFPALSPFPQKNMLLILILLCLKNIPPWLIPCPSHCCCPTSSIPSTLPPPTQALLHSLSVSPSCLTHLTSCHKFWLCQTTCPHFANPIHHHSIYGYHNT